ncbi:MAG: ferritin family protein [Candidatus Omnitrophica bacterium]|nr:ferritin family protein [Candidatus Omnitrophota bacterium]
MDILHISEIVDIGIEKEKKRRDFYAQAAEHFPQPELRELFIRLKDWEDMHIRKFTEIRQTLGNGESAESYPGELSLYMQSLVDDRLYQEVSAAGFKKNVSSPEEAIRYGITFEKDAVLFFTELKNYCAQAHRGIIDKLIDEEKQHIVYLSELRGKI